MNANGLAKNKILSAVTSVLLTTYNLTGVIPLTFADPPDGRGNERSQEAVNNNNGNQNNNQGNGNDNANNGNQGQQNRNERADQATGAERGNSSTENGLSRAEIVRNGADHAQSRQAGGRNFHAREPGDHGQRQTPADSSDRNDNAAGEGEANVSERPDAGIGRDASNRRSQNRAIIEDFEQVVGELRREERARWWFNPVDDRPQGNRGRVEMQDPYGFARDDRMEIYGNRGRPIRERDQSEPETPDDQTGDGSTPGEETPSDVPIGEEPTTTFLSENAIFVDYATYWAWYCANYSCATSITFESLGYTAEEAAFLQSLSSCEIANAYYTGYITMPATETTVQPISQLDMSQLINYADAYQYVYMPGDTVEYDLSLTNPYDEPITLAINVTIEYMKVVWVYNAEQNTYQRRYLDGQAVQGESTETWQTITLQPGETITLYDDYYMPLTAYWSNYQFHVTLTDLSTGLIYDDPAAGWFDPPLDVAGAHRSNI